MALKKASTETTQIPLGEGDYIIVRNQVSKRVRNAVAAHLPARIIGMAEDETPTLTTGEATELQTGLFEALVVGWSADAPATIDEYLDLEPEDADRIDKALAEHWQTLQPTKAEGKAAFRHGRAPRKGASNGDTAGPVA